MSPQAPRNPAPRPPVDRRFAKDVAKQVDRRQVRRKLLLWLILVSAIVLAVMYGTCGRGFGIGGKGKGEGKGAGPGSAQPLLTPVDGAPRRCQVRISASGIAVDGKPATIEEVVAACKAGKSAELLVTGGARRSDRKEIETAFEQAGIQILRIERQDEVHPGSTGSAEGAGSAAATP